MAPSLTQQVFDRAGGRCEYCHLPQSVSNLPFEIDHIIARKHQGLTVLTNLALSCWYCNSFKGSDIAGFDPVSGKLTRLFNPRRQRWLRHFRFEGPVLIGQTAIGRTTIRMLQMNREEAIILRESLMAEGVFPLE